MYIYIYIYFLNSNINSQVCEFKFTSMWIQNDELSSWLLWIHHWKSRSLEFDSIELNSEVWGWDVISFSWIHNSDFWYEIVYELKFYEFIPATQWQGALLIHWMGESDSAMNSPGLLSSWNNSGLCSWNLACWQCLT